LGLGFWGLGFGPHPQTPNPQSPIPNPQSPIINLTKIYKIKIILIINNFYNILSKNYNLIRGFIKSLI